MLIVSQFVDLLARAGGPRVAHQILLRRLERWRTYEAEYYMLDRLVDRRRTAVDVGGNIGVFSGRLAQLCPRVLCFEPIPWFAAALRAKLSARVIVNEIALSDHEGWAELRIPYAGDVENHGNSTMEAANTLHEATRVKRVGCAVNLLDNVVDEPVGFIKIDVEGHELAVLRGATRTLTRYQPTLLIESEKRHNSAAPEAIFRFMAELGFSGEFLDEGTLKPVAAFRPDVHQQEDALRTRMREGPLSTCRYVNNFIFRPTSKAGPDQSGFRSY